MVIRGRSRSNGRQLARYLLSKGMNERVRILDVNGLDQATERDLSDALFSMDITAELTKGDKGLYHAQVNPAIGEDRLMGDEEWLQAANILGKELGLDDQRRVIVLHTKNGRTHAHVAWERYDHIKGTLKSDSWSFPAHDRARQEMERVFGHEPTPHRNKRQPELKVSLTKLWHQTGTGAQFVKAAKENNFLIVQGGARRSYMVVDEYGRSFDLVRQLEGVKTKDVRQRMAGMSLADEKTGISYMRNAQTRQKDKQSHGKEKLFTSNIKYMADKQQSAKQAASEQFAANGNDATQSKEKQQSRSEQLKGQFNQNKNEISANDEKQKGKQEKDKLEFKQNMNDIDPRRASIQQRFQEMDHSKERDKEKGMEMD